MSRSAARRSKTNTFGTAAVLVAASLLPATAGAQVADQWTYSLTPYLWLPGVDAKLRYGPPPPGGSSGNVGIDSEDILEKLDFAFMLQGEARKGRWLIAGDLIYLDFGGQRSQVRSVDFNPGSGPVNVATSQLDSGTQSSLEATVFTLVGGYNLQSDATATHDVIAGMRYIDVSARTDWNLTAAVTGPGGTQSFARTGSVEQSTDLVDAIIGVRGRFRLGDGPWFVPYHVDVGAGSSKFTWQGVVGVGHGFKWGDLTLTYRHLYYDEGDDKFLQEITFGGLALGATFRF